MIYKTHSIVIGGVTPGGIVYDVSAANTVLSQACAYIEKHGGLPGRISPLNFLDELRPDLASHLVRDCWIESVAEGELPRLMISYEPVANEIGDVLRRIIDCNQFYFAPRGVARLREGTTYVEAEGYRLITFDCHPRGLTDT